VRRILLAAISVLLACGALGAQELKDIEAAYLKIVRKVRPSVVAVTVVKESRKREGGRVVARIATTQFSGVVVSQEGHIATIAKGVKDASRIYIDTLQGSRHSAELVGVDDRHNVGIIKVKDLARWKPTPIEFGDSADLEVGSLTVIVGCPSGLKHSVVYGNVSGLNRTLVSSSKYYTGMIQLSNPVSHSNPGGLVANSEGKLVGMISPAFIKTPSFRRVEELIDALNEKLLDLSEKMAREKQEDKEKEERKPTTPSKAARDRLKRRRLTPDLYDPALSQGINFAIPGNSVKEVCDRIVKGKKQPWLGVLVRELTAPEKAQFGLQAGLFVLHLVPKGPAVQGGLEIRDIITGVGGKPIEGVEKFRSTIQNSVVGAELKLTVYRKGKKSELKIKLGKRK
jgi:S1-C subfamily serine protease